LIRFLAESKPNSDADFTDTFKKWQLSEDLREYYAEHRRSAAQAPTSVSCNGYVALYSTVRLFPIGIISSL